MSPSAPVIRASALLSVREFVSFASTDGKAGARELHYAISACTTCRVSALRRNKTTSMARVMKTLIAIHSGR